MTLSPGTRFGPYDVQRPIGAGGMGEVYCARDTELDRLVALKVLPDLFLRDPERLARFEREAKTLASLNHPHIAQIYGLVHGPENIRALAMEFVEGEDLGDRLRRGPLPLDEALPITRQIAEALEAAHEIGVVHRDLKPANIKVRPDGAVKVLDFGLARMVLPPESSAPDRADSPTITSPAMTERGVILGTAAYMSPEQAKGRLVDRRTDIWGLGCVLYDMLTGHRAFGGDTVTETITSVLRDTPDWQRLPAETPAAIRKLLKKCLEKDRSKRLDSAASVRMEIEDVLAGAVDGPVVDSRSRGRERRAWTLAAIFAIAAIVSTGVTVWPVRTLPVPQEIRLDVTTPDAADPYSFALSPDGTKIAFSAGGDNHPIRLWLRSFDNATATPLADTDGAVHPFWSPDSQSIGFIAYGKLKRLDRAGGAAVTLADAPVSRGGSWNADGTILFAPISIGPISRVAASGSAPVVITTMAAGDGGHRVPAWHPDGRRFFYFLQSGDSELRGVYLATLDRPGSKRIVTADGSAQFRPPDQLVYVREGTLFAQTFDDATNEVTGAPIALANPVPTLYGRSAFSVSASGVLAYRTGRVMGAQLRWFNRQGEDVGAFAEPDLATPFNPVLSPRGQRVVIRRTVQGNDDLWILDSARSAAARLTTDPGGESLPVWAPDESRLVFRSTRAAKVGLYQAEANAGRGDELLLAASALSSNVTTVTPTDWSPDGKWLVFYSTDPLAARDLWILPMGQTESAPRLFLSTKFDESTARFSPDGRWIAYQTNESGRLEIAVRSFPTAGGVWQVSSGGGVHARWSRDGKELFFVAPNGQLMAAPIDASGAAFRAGPPVALFAPRFAEPASDNPFSAQYDVASDGRILINMSLDQAAASPITLILNWKGGTQ